MKYGSKYISRGDDDYIYLSDFSIGAASLWRFESVYAAVTTVYPAMFNYGAPTKYKMSENTNLPTETHALNLLRSSRVFFSNTHGLGDEDEHNIGLDLGVANLTNARIDTLPTNDLSAVKLVVYVGCKTGEGGTTANNTVNSTYNKGAQVVIGFKKSIAGAHADWWVDKFMPSLAAGDTIEEAMRKADNYVNSRCAIEGEDPQLILTDERTVRGNTNVTVAEV